MRIVSCNPLEVPGPGIAPAYSGLPADDTSEWAAFRAEYDRTHRPTWSAFNDWVQEQGAKPLPDLEFVPTSRARQPVRLPAEADYTDARPLDATWHRLDSSVRGTDVAFEVPAQLADRPAGSGLVYLSLGSLGQRRRRPHAPPRRGARRTAGTGSSCRMGPRHDELTLPDNMWGAEFLPQTSVLPQVDLVITHGGNNTTTESFHFGKPMVLLPLFWDQYDNAQRVDELGFGVRLDTYRFTDDELLGAVDRLLADDGLRQRMAEIGTSVRARDGLTRGADVIEDVARRYADGRS